MSAEAASNDPAGRERLDQAREAVIVAHMGGESRKDVDEVLATMPDPTYDLVTIGRVLRGRREVGRLLQNMFDALGPGEHRPLRIHHSGDDAIVELVVVFPDGIDGSTPGAELRVHTVAIFSFDGEALSAERVYVDPTQLAPLLEGV